MGHWGVKCYENDDADFAIDAGMEKVHEDAYEALMDDRNALSFDDAQKKLANPETLAAAVESLRQEYGNDRPLDDWDETERLGLCGVIVRHAEFVASAPVPVPTFVAPPRRLKALMAGARRLPAV